MTSTVQASVVDLLLSATNAGTKVYAGQQPETVALPFIVVEHQGEIAEWRAGGDYVETTTLVIHCFAKTLAAMDAIQIAAKSTLDWCNEDGSLTVTDAEVIEFRRLDYRSIPQDIRAPDAEIVFDGAITYQAKIQRADAHA